MHIEELRKLKKDIEEKRELELETENIKRIKQEKENKYYPLSLDDMYIDDLVNYELEEKDFKSMDEIIDSENTDEVVKQCEEAIKTILLNLSEAGIPYDQIQLYSVIKFYCKVNFVKEIKEFYAHHSYDKFDKLKFQKIMNELPNQSIIPFIPVELHFDGNYTGTKDESIWEGYYKYPNFNYLTLNDIKITGVVCIREFIKKMSNLGYDINISSFNDCIKESIDDETFNITADFGRKEKINRINLIKK